MNNGRPLADRGVLVWLRLARVYHRLSHAASAELEEFGLSLPQFDVLAQIGSHEGLCQQDLAEALLVTKGNVTHLLFRMERAGWVERRPDGRNKRLFLTASGHDLYRRAVPCHEAWLREQFASLSLDDQTTLLGLLRQVEHAQRRAS